MDGTSRLGPIRVTRAIRGLKPPRCPPKKPGGLHSSLGAVGSRFCDFNRRFLLKRALLATESRELGVESRAAFGVDDEAREVTLKFGARGDAAPGGEGEGLVGVAHGQAKLP